MLCHLDFLCSAKIDMRIFDQQNKRGGYTKVGSLLNYNYRNIDDNRYYGKS